jgi:hypothetical protein
VVSGFKPAVHLQAGRAINNFFARIVIMLQKAGSDEINMERFDWVWIGKHTDQALLCRAKQRS